MIAMWVKVRVKPEGLERFLKAIEVDALGSERDERDCFRFNVLQDQRLLLLRGLSRREGTRSASGGAALRGVARRRRHSRRPAAGDALRYGFPCGDRLLGAQVGARVAPGKAAYSGPRSASYAATSSRIRGISSSPYWIASGRGS